MDISDLKHIAAGASRAALDYISEVLGVQEGEPLEDERHQAFLLVLTQTAILLEVTLRLNIRNPEAAGATSAAIEDMVEKIWKKQLAKLNGTGKLGNIGNNTFYS